MMNSGFNVKAAEQDTLDKWIAEIGNLDRIGVGILSWKQGWGNLKIGRSIVDETLCLAGKVFETGLGTHANSEIVLRSSHPIKTFRAKVGLDHNSNTVNATAEIMFSVFTEGVCRWSSPYQKVSDQPAIVEVDLDGAVEFTLMAKAKDSVHLAHADWAEAEVISTDGRTIVVGCSESTRYSSIMPVSFIYNGMTSEQWFRQWGITRSQSPGKTYNTLLFKTQDRDTGLKCTIELQQYLNSPACLWNVYFTNTGNAPTPILAQVKSLALCWPSDRRKTLYRARGAFHYKDGEKFEAEAFRDDFMMVRDNLKTPVAMGGTGGRSSVDWMPYFNFQTQDEGLMFGIGWAGQWQAQIKAEDDCVSFLSGMENIHTVLNPGETIRQPAILMIYWQGTEAIRGHNLLRQFIKANLAPRAEGKVMQAPVCNLTWGGMIAASHLARLQNIETEKIPFDYYWIDAGWYGNAGPNKDEFAPQWGSQAGDWSINHDTFPHEFKDISAMAHAGGKKFLLWFEPERAIQGTPITLEHPEWFLGTKVAGSNMLLNLGNPDAWQWCVEMVAGMIAEQKIDCYRQDFNFSPLPYWQSHDTPDRVGISEIRYVAGLYAFLGELRRRFPHLLIDNCASGGRRLDFEMMRYSIPLWSSDMQCFPDYISERNLQQVQGLSYWLPQFAFGTQDRAEDTYHFRTTMAAGLVVHLFPYEYRPISAEYPYQWLRDRLDEYHRAKNFFSGDFYPLCDQTDSFKSWTANQFHRPDLKSGILEVFRKKESDIEKMRLRLQDLTADVHYEFEDADRENIVTVSGKELMANGLPVEIGKRRDSRLFFYRQKAYSKGNRQPR
jgi:alpha-galactosidase